MQNKLGTHAEVLLEAGDVPGAVGAAVERNHVDLLVIGRGLIDGSRLPTNTYAIIRKSPCPVVSV